MIYILPVFTPKTVVAYMFDMFLLSFLRSFESYFVNCSFLHIKPVLRQVEKLLASYPDNKKFLVFKSVFK